VVNILTGSLGDTAPTLAAHLDVNAIDLTGAAGDTDHATQLEVSAVDNLKRVLRILGMARAMKAVSSMGA
jgi:hypothetical protein